MVHTCTGASGDIAEDDGDAEDEVEGGDLEELEFGTDGLHGDHLEPGDGNIAKEGVGGHVAHGEEDRILEAIVAQKVLVEEQYPNVGGVPRRHQSDREETA